MASSSIPCLLIIFLCLLPFISVSGASNISLSSSLSASVVDNSSSWVSPSGEFAFGFRQLDNTSIFLLAIWFDKIPAKTIVWHANTPTPVQTGSMVSLTANGLTVTGPDGQTIWKAPEFDTTVSYGAMLDTGNFVLSTRTSSSNSVWESFDYPTDTILPTQTLPRGGMLYSIMTENNYSRGRFELRFTDSGNLELNPIAWPSEFRYSSYYSFGSTSSTTDPSESGSRLVFNQSNIYIEKENGGVLQLSWQVPAPDYLAHYHRATLGNDGVFRQYVFPKSSDGDRLWFIYRDIPENICALRNEFGSGACGFNSYCMASEGSVSTPLCQCPIGYSLMDPGNKHGGCKPNFPLGCVILDEDGISSINQEDLYELRTMPNVNWPLGDYEALQPFNQTQCEQSCLHDCSCAVAIFSGVTCWKKRLPLSNGRVEIALAIIKVRKGNAALPPPNLVGPDDDPIPKPYSKKASNQILMWSLVSGSSGFFNILLLVVIISLVVISRRRKKLENFVHNHSNFPDTNLRIFTFKELKQATDGFKEELGRGSFGIVYKGLLKSGSRNHQVAVKMLGKLSEGGEKEFKAEVTAVGKTHHRNLVQLLGYCDDGLNRLLVYEFMSNGSLSDFLFSQIPRPDWHRRTQVALGIARGLVYLHEECSAPIIHCDIKPQNILIDEYFTARISDFGLAKSLMLDQTRTHTEIRGTKGYVAPEWFKNVPITVRVDVHSFGVMLLEIICCRKSVETEVGEESRVILTDWAYDRYMEGRVADLVEEICDEAAMRDIGTLHKWVITALCCIQENPAKRPTMNMVIQMLEGHVEVPIPSFSASSFSIAKV